MKTLLVGLLIAVLLAWGVSFTPASNADLAWQITQEALNLTGFLAIAFMSLTMLLAIRPKWLEKPLDGLDRMYRTHKWAGILAVGFAVAHWFIKEVIGDYLKSAIGKAGKIPKDHFIGIFEALRHSAKGIGEWAFYIVAALVVLALWKRFPYKPWRLLHKVMPAIFLALVFHSVMFMPLYYWTQPLGWLMAALMAVGTYASIITLLGRIGVAQRTLGVISDIQQPTSSVLSLRIKLDKPWQQSAGQFAFIKFSDFEGHHPFTIASAPNADQTVEFHIKALGDFTNNLANHVSLGQQVELEGPYGQFKLERTQGNAQQVWVAGGIGVTPFLAWLEEMQHNPQSAPKAALHYCTQDRENDPFVSRLLELSLSLSNFRLHIYGSKQGEVLDAKKLGLHPQQAAELWFCGPTGLANKLKNELNQVQQPVRFHQELFEMR